MKKLIVFLLLLAAVGIVGAAQTTVNTSSDTFKTAWDRQQAMNTELYGSVGALIIGTDVQAYDADLASLSGATSPSAKSVYYYNGSSYEWATSLGVDIVLYDESPDTAGQITYDASTNVLELYSTSAVRTFSDDAAIAGVATITASGFDGNLATTDNTIQEVAQALDDVVILDESANETITGDWTFSGDITIGNLADNSITASMLDDWYAYEVIPVAWMKDGTSAPADLDDASTRAPYAYRDFDATADEDLNFVWFVPSDLSGTTIQYRVKYLVTNATGPSSTEGVAFGLSGICAGDNDATNGTKGTVVVITDDTLNAAQHDLLITGWSGDVTITNLAAGEVAECALIRDVSDAVDDYAQDVGVIALEIRYVKNPAGN